MAMNKEEVWAKNQTLSEKDMEIDTGGSMIVCECVCVWGGGGGWLSKKNNGLHLYVNLWQFISDFR